MQQSYEKVNENGDPLKMCGLCKRYILYENFDQGRDGNFYRICRMCNERLKRYRNKHKDIVNARKPADKLLVYQRKYENSLRNPEASSKEQRDSLLGLLKYCIRLLENDNAPKLLQQQALDILAESVGKRD